MAEKTFEPGAYTVFAESTGVTSVDRATVSIAISLKRIADALHLAPGAPVNLFDLISNISEK